MRLFLIIMISLMPCIVSAEIYSWTDNNGVVNHTSDLGNVPESELQNRGLERPSKSAKAASDNKKNSTGNATGIVSENIKRVTELARQIDDGVKYADEYYEKDRPVSKSMLISYLNSMSYEIGNLKNMLESSALDEESKRTVASQLAFFDAKYILYNNLVNDIDTIEVSRLKSDTQFDYKTRRDFDANYNRISTTIMEENNVFTFTATITNKGSKADVAVELKGLNYNETSVASHIIKTSIGSAQSKEISDRIIVPVGLSKDIFRWVISDVKIVRARK